MKAEASEMEDQVCGYHEFPPLTGVDYFQLFKGTYMILVQMLWEIMQKWTPIQKGNQLSWPKFRRRFLTDSRHCSAGETLLYRHPCATPERSNSLSKRIERIYSNRKSVQNATRNTSNGAPWHLPCDTPSSVKCFCFSALTPSLRFRWTDRPPL